MFDKLYLWMQNIAFYMVMVTAVMHIIPNSDYKRYIHFFTGLILVVMLASPFLKFLGLGDSWQNLYASKAYQEQVKKMEQAIQTLEEADTNYYDIWEEEQRDALSGDSKSNSEKTEESNKIDVEEIKIGR